MGKILKLLIRAKKATSIFMFLLFINLICSAQNHSISGKIFDSNSKEPLAFVNIAANDGKQGVTSSIEGYFKLKSNAPIDSIRFSYVGYFPKTIYKDDLKSGKIEVALQKQSLELQEVVILPGENPAHRIIQKTIDNRNINNPLKNSSFSYTSYNKMIFTSDIVGDTTLAVPKDLPDSLKTPKQQLYEFLNEKHLFMMENVNQRIFKAPSNNYEKVIASKVSGFKDPFFTIINTQIQGISFYNELFVILDKKYVNPISRGSTSKYFFLMQDTLYQNLDTVFVISFRPRINTNFDGLEGLLYINTNGYALQNVTAKPHRDEKGISVNIQHQYELIDNKKWFPVQLNTELYFSNVSLNNVGQIVAKGWSYITDIEIDPELKRRDFGNAELDLDVVSERESGKILEKYRVQPLTKQEEETYVLIDSLSKEANLEKHIGTAKTLMTGFIPISIFNLQLDKLYRYNHYEQSRLGIGFMTNRKLLKNISFGGYIAYSFGNKHLNYGGTLETYFNRKKSFKGELIYKFDVLEDGNLPLYFDNSSLLDFSLYRHLYINRFNHHRQISYTVSGKPNKRLTLLGSISHQEIFPGYDYNYTNLENNQIFSKNHIATLAEATIGVRYAYNEQIFANDGFMFVTNSDYPVFTLQITHAFPNILGSDYEFNKIDATFSYSYRWKYVGKTSLFLKAGYIDRALPQWGTYAFASNLNKEYIFASQSFSTMPFNKYYASQHVNLFFTHNFGKSLIRKKYFKPEPIIHQNIGFGWNHQVNFSSNISTTAPEKGYFESGIMINNIIDLGVYSIGAGAFYCYGDYASSEILSNFAFKWGISFPIN